MVYYPYSTGRIPRDTWSRQSRGGESNPSLVPTTLHSSGHIIDNFMINIDLSDKRKPQNILPRVEDLSKRKWTRQILQVAKLSDEAFGHHFYPILP